MRPARIDFGCANLGELQRQLAAPFPAAGARLRPLAASPGSSAGSAGSWESARYVNQEYGVNEERRDQAIG